MTAKLSSAPIDICFVSSKHPPKDKRVFEKEALSLAQAGFRVAHVAPGAPSNATEGGVELHTYPEPRTLVDRVLQIPRLFKRARDLDAAAYHCNEIDSWLVGVLLKLATRRKLVFDVHELYPAEFAESRFPPPLRPLAAAAIRVAIRTMLPFTDRLVLAKASVAPDYPGSAFKQVLVENFTSLAASGELNTPKRRASRGRIKAVHLGGISRPRGWPQLLEALAEPGIENVDLLLLGDFPERDQAAFEAAARAKGLSERIEIVPWLPFREAFAQLLDCDIGLILFQPGRLNHVHASPHKLFDYMLAELPVIAPGFAIEVARIVRATDCGLLVDPSDSRDIARALRALSMNAETRRQLGSRGRAAVLERYNWEKEAEKLVDTYEDLFRQQ